MSSISDIALIQRVFPNLERYDCNFSDRHLIDESIQRLVTPANHHQSILTHYKFISGGKTHFPVGSLNSLLQQPHLQSLTLYGIDILTDLRDVHCEVQFTNLTTLEIGSLSPYTGCIKSQFTNLKWLLLFLPKLEVFRFGFDPFDEIPRSVEDELQPLLECVKVNLPQLNTLGLTCVVQPDNIEILCLYLKHMSHVNTLELWWEDVEGREHVLGQELEGPKHITHFKMIHTV